MVKVKIGTSILTPEEGENGETRLWLPVEFAREIVKVAIDRGLSSITFNNIVDPEVGEISMFDDEIDQVLEMDITIKKEGT